jgi:hypothetical protein
MATIKGSKINRWLMIVAVTWIAGFCLSVGVLCALGIITIPAQYRLATFLSMPFTGAAAFLFTLLVLLDPPGTESSDS